MGDLQDEQLGAEGNERKDRDAQPSGRDVPAQVRGLLPSRDPAAIAAAIRNNPGSAPAIYAMLHETHGNQFVMQVAALVDAGNADAQAADKPPDAEQCFIQNNRDWRFSHCLLRNAFSSYSDLANKKLANFDPSKIQVLGEAEFRAAMWRLHAHLYRNPMKLIALDLAGFVSPFEDNTVYINAEKAEPSTFAHELLHTYIGPGFRGTALEEGLTQYLAIKAFEKVGLKASGSYAQEVSLIRMLIDQGFEEKRLIAGYFGWSVQVVDYNFKEFFKGRLGTWQKFQKAWGDRDFTQCMVFMQKDASAPARKEDDGEH